MYHQIPTLRALHGGLGDTLAPGIYSVVVSGDNRAKMSTWLSSNSSNVTIASQNIGTEEDHPWYEGGELTDWIADDAAYTSDSYTFQVNDAVDWDTADFGQPTPIVTTPTPAVKITPGSSSSTPSSSASSSNSSTPASTSLTDNTVLLVVGGITVLALGITLAVLHKKRGH